MVINDLTNPFFAEMAVGIEAALQTAGLIPFLANTGESPTRQAAGDADDARARRRRLHRCARRSAPTPLIWPRFEAWGLPVVTVMRRLPGGWLSSVAPDNVGGARRATEHLLGLGHRRIAFLGGRAGMVVHEERRAGWRDGAAPGAGLPADPALVVESTPNRDGGARPCSACLALPEPPTAALCFNDVVAIGVMLRPGRGAGSSRRPRLRRGRLRRHRRRAA